MIKTLVSTKIKNLTYEVGKEVSIGSQKLVVEYIYLTNRYGKKLENTEEFIVTLEGGYTLSLPYGDFGMLYPNEES